METLVNNLVYATGWSIFHSLWQGALIYALLLPFQMKELGLSAKLKCALAYVAICLMFGSFVITFFLSYQSAAENVTAPLAIPTLLTLSPQLPQNLIGYIEMLFPYLVLAYSMGLMVQSVIVIQGYRKVQLLKKAVYTQVPEDWQKAFNKLMSRLAIQKRVSFRLSEHVLVPMVIGYFKPMILFPVALAAHVNIEQLETILIHELSHIRRNDYVLNLLRTVINTLLFFNPFVWFSSKFISIEREHACDDLVIQLTDTPVTYAHALLTLEIYSAKHNPVFAMAATGDKQYLYQRIKRITAMKTNDVNSKQKLVAITLTVATIMSLAWIKPSADKPIVNKPTLVNNHPIPLNEFTILQDTTKKNLKKSLKRDYSVSANTFSINPIKPTSPAPFPAPPTAPVPALNIPVPLSPEVPVNAPTAISISPLTSDMISATLQNADNAETIKINLHVAKAEALNQMQESLQSKREAHQEKFNSDEQRAKWQAYAKEIRAKFDTPEERAKWKNYAADMKAKFDSPEQRAKWEKLAKETQAQFNSPEHKEMVKKIVADVKIQAVQARNLISHQQAFSIDAEHAKNQQLKNNKEYIELKKKFDRDVEELMNKKTTKEAN